jgi:Heavy metal associated domain 2
MSRMSSSELPRAFVSHSAPGRIRLRVPQMRNQAEYFANLRERLTSLAGLRGLTTNLRTASVLIEHVGDAPDLAEVGRRLELFQLELAAKPPTLSQHIYGLVSQPDSFLKRLTNGRVDVAGLTVLALTGMGISQVVKGQALPAGWTLLWNAANLVRDAGAGHAPEQPPHPGTYPTPDESS